VGDLPIASQSQPVGENEMPIVQPFLFQPSQPLIVSDDNGNQP